MTKENDEGRGNSPTPPKFCPGCVSVKMELKETYWECPNCTTLVPRSITIANRIYVARLPNEPGVKLFRPHKMLFAVPKDAKKTEKDEETVAEEIKRRFP
jgi:hypothetical protein